MNVRNPLVTMLVVLMISAIMVSVTAIWIYIFRPSAQIVALIVTLLILVPISVFIYFIRKNEKRIESIDKGKKLTEIIVKSDKILRAAAGIYLGCVSIILLWEILIGDWKGVKSILPAVAVVPAIVISVFVPRKYSIYEKGIKLGLRFIEWKEVTKYEWKEGKLEIRFKGLPKKIVVEDKNKEIKRIIEKLLRGEKGEL